MFHFFSLYPPIRHFTFCLGTFLFLPLKTDDHSSGQVTHLVTWVGGIYMVSDDEVFVLQHFKCFFEPN